MDKKFSERVIDAVMSLPPGRVATYGDIARVCGAGGQAARSISGILSRAEKKGIKKIPWHRIVYSGGKVWSSTDTNKKRLHLYKQEGIIVNNKGQIMNFELIRYRF